MNPDGTLTRLAGGRSLFPFDYGPAREVRFVQTRGMAFDDSGRIYLAAGLDSPNYGVLRIDPDGTIRVVVGNRQRGSTGDGGPATGAAVGAFDIAFDAQGNLLVSDYFGNRVRRVTGPLP